MSIWNKVLIGLICVAAIGFWYLAMRTLKTHQYWRELAQKHERRIEEVKAENQTLAHGGGQGADAKLGIRQYRQLIHQLVVDRGRVWTNCEPRGFNAQTGQGTIVTDQPIPNGLAPKAIIHVFEEKEAAAAGNGGRYLGEFEIEAVADNQLQVRPTLKLDPARLQRIAQASKPWILYEKMPADSHTLLAGLSEEELKQMMPAASVPAYIHDGQEATWDQIAQWNAEGVLVGKDGKPLVDAEGKPLPGAQGTFVRQLHDYGAIFRRRFAEKSLLADRFEWYQRDIAYLRQSVAEAKEQVAMREREVQSAKAELQAMTRERDAAQAQVVALQKRVDAVQGLLKQLLAANKQIVDQIAQVQFDAARRIDAKTRAMAQTPEGGE